MQVLIIDNYDSFVYNIVQYIEQLGIQCTVVRNNDPSLGEHLPETIAHYDGVLISPGPSSPAHAGQSLAVIRECAHQSKPLLGVCLGHQAIGEVFGSQTIRANEILHGKTSMIHHNSHSILTELPNPFRATRYHSLIIDKHKLNDDVEIIAETTDGTIMAIAHKNLPIWGIQFHPESILTTGGHRILANWLNTFGAQIREEKIQELEQSLITV